MTKQFLTTEEAAKFLGWNPETGKGGFTPSTLRSWRARGTGPEFVQPAGRRGKALYPRAALETWLKTGKGTK